jgi:hypothetical protein
MTERWRQYWFAPASPRPLAVCRILFFGALFLFYWPTDFAAWAHVSNVFLQPIWLFTRLHLTAVPREWLATMQVVWRAALVFSCVGLFTRASTLVAFTLGVYILGLPNNFGTEFHYDTLVLMTLGILAIARSGDDWSLDRVLRAWRRDPGRIAPVEWSGEYTWPIKFVQLVMALIFFAAGVAKIRHGGLAWITSNTMGIMLVQQQYHVANADPLTRLGLTIAAHPWLCSILAASTMTFETIYPLALISARARAVIVPSVFLMQVGIRVVLGPTFGQYLICNLFWVPWDRVLRVSDARFKRPRESNAGVVSAGISEGLPVFSDAPPRSRAQ